MDQLDRSGAGDGLVGSGPGSERRIGGTEGQGRPEPLASGRDQMTGHLAEEAVLGVDLVGQTGLDPGQVARQGFEADILEEAHARPLSALRAGPLGPLSAPWHTRSRRSLLVVPLSALVMGRLRAPLPSGRCALRLLGPGRSGPACDARSCRKAIGGTAHDVQPGTSGPSEAS